MKNNNYSTDFIFSDEVQDALSKRWPVVALESSVFCQGLPFEIASSSQAAIEQAVRNADAIPATISVLDGRIQVGTTERDRQKLLNLRQDNQIKKLAERDLAIAQALELSGGTTVSATCLVAHLVGIEVFATGGIGGVHRGFGPSLDISADLKSLATYPLIVVSAGIKSILDVPKTLEVLECLSVPVMSFRADSFPNFYCSTSVVKSPHNALQVEEVVAVYKMRKKHRAQEAILLAQPTDAHVAIDSRVFEELLLEAMKVADALNIADQAVTPFLLQYLAEKTDNKTVKANISLLINNAKLAAQLAVKLSLDP